MTRLEVLNELCSIASSVGRHFEHRIASDCFCAGAAIAPNGYQFDPMIIRFIREAVSEKIASTNTTVTFHEASHDPS